MHTKLNGMNSYGLLSEGPDNVLPLLNKSAMRGFIENQTDSMYDIF